MICFQLVLNCVLIRFMAIAQHRCVRNLAVVVFAFILVLLSLPVLFRKRSVPLLLNGKVIEVATRPFVMPWEENDFGIYAGNSKVFGLWGDAFDSPLFIYLFVDGKRFLCIDDDDTSVLVFVVDFRGLIANTTNSFGWPPDSYTRAYMASRSTNVVMDTKGYIRLPTFAEVQEASSNLTQLSPEQFKDASFPAVDFGVLRSYWPKEKLLSELATNRQSVLP